jgi:hypothetical protein
MNDREAVYTIIFHLIDNKIYKNVGKVSVWRAAGDNLNESS